jgi:hypothetical protein
MAQCIRTCLGGRSCACAHADHAHCPWTALPSNARHMSVLPGCFSAEPLNPISEGAVSQSKQRTRAKGQAVRDNEAREQNDRAAASQAGARRSIEIQGRQSNVQRSIWLW